LGSEGGAEFAICDCLVLVDSVACDSEMYRTLSSRRRRRQSGDVLGLMDSDILTPRRDTDVRSICRLMFIQPARHTAESLCILHRV